MDNKSKLQEIYDLYSQGKYPEAYKKTQDILLVDPENVYAKRYEQILSPHLNKASEVGKIQTIKGKKLTCPHCQSPIPMSALTSEAKESIRDNNYSNLDIKCPYCHAVFTLQKKSAESTLGIKIGDKITHNGIEYRVTGYVRYDGMRHEHRYSGRLRYLEWILLGADGSYLYFSEGFFVDDGVSQNEFELSHKITPSFSLQPDFKNKVIIIDGRKIAFSEWNIVNANMLHGENSKVFTVGEVVELYEFSYKGHEYVIEKESAGRQSEAGVYKTQSMNRKKAAELFGKEYGAVAAFGEGVISLNHLSEGASGYFIYAIIIIVYIATSLLGFSLKIGGFFLMIAFIILLFWILVFLKPDILKSKRLYLLIVGPIIGLGVVPAVANIFLEEKTPVPVQDITPSKKYEIEFVDPDLQTQSVVRTTRYDYGGVKTTYQKRKGLQFSVKNATDEEIIEKIQSGDFNNDELKEIFDQPIYKIK